MENITFSFIFACKNWYRYFIFTNVLWVACYEIYELQYNITTVSIKFTLLVGIHLIFSQTCDTLDVSLLH